MKNFYFDIEHAIKIHDLIIEISGGKKGIIDDKSIGRIESVIINIQIDTYYPEFLDKMTHLCFSINKFHGFVDGNKRTSIALGAYFLKINGYDYCVKEFIKEMENPVIWIAENKIDKLILRDIIEDVIMQESRESTKNKILNSL